MPIRIDEVQAAVMARRTDHVARRRRAPLRPPPVERILPRRVQPSSPKVPHRLGVGEEDHLAGRVLERGERSGPAVSADQNRVDPVASPRVRDRVQAGRIAAAVGARIAGVAGAVKDGSAAQIRLQEDDETRAGLVDAALAAVGVDRAPQGSHCQQLNEGEAMLGSALHRFAFPMSVAHSTPTGYTPPGSVS